MQITFILSPLAGDKMFAPSWGAFRYDQYVVKVGQEA
jgi:hypothetical protein